MNPGAVGTKAAAWYSLALPAGAEASVRLRLTTRSGSDKPPERLRPGLRRPPRGQRAQEADEFYANAYRDSPLSAEERRIVRQADRRAPLVEAVLQLRGGAMARRRPVAARRRPPARRAGRNRGWRHFYARDVLSVPDNWEYPWFAAWDLAFQCVAAARIDPDFAKRQLLLLCREWYMHPNGQLPAYEFAFGDVNPPVHAWAAWRVYQLDAAAGLRADRLFLERVFQKCMLNFTWWVNRKDVDGNNLFTGGFLGLDNIGFFDRSKPLPGGGQLQQADGTAWMAFYCSTMLAIALELAREDPAYDDIASKFFEHFVGIARAMNELGGTGLWDEQDGFYYDQPLVDGQSHPAARPLDGGHHPPLRGGDPRRRAALVPAALPRAAAVVPGEPTGAGRRTSPSCTRTRGKSTGCSRSPPRTPAARPAVPARRAGVPLALRRPLALAFHRDHPGTLRLGGRRLLRVRYVPGESDSGFFGGNSNWRGPVWFPVNYLLIEALKRYHHFFGEDFKVECPTGSGQQQTLPRSPRT